MSHKPVYGADELHFPGCKPAVRFKLAFPDGEGRMGWGTKGPKQIRTELFSLFLVKLPPTEGRMPFTLLRQEKTCYTRTSPNFNFLVFSEFLIEFLIGFPD